MESGGNTFKTLGKLTRRTPRSPEGIPRGLPLLTSGKLTRRTPWSRGGAISKRLQLLTPGKLTREILGVWGNS